MNYWLLTLLIVHILATIGAFVMLRTAPCWMQKLAMFGIAMAMAIFTLAYFVALVGAINPALGWWGEWHIALVAAGIEHIAVLLIIFRLVYQRHLRMDLEWANSSTSSRSYQP